ncbi:FecR family protein [Hydrotalea sp.]|uniref:FecR family protein n=1 Tax=Hydrotalea sp. TaxID=2881279 RepID=UPI00263536F6|nr:FecR family protein [Hydrotalea sp.]
MEKNDRIWQLLARKLAKEATDAELDELAALLKQQEGDAEIAAILEKNWQTFPEVDMEFLDATYLLHLQRMQEQGIVMGAAHHNDTLNAPADHIHPKKSTFKKYLIAGMLPFIIILLAAGWWQFSKKEQQTIVLPVTQSVEIPNEIVTKNASKTKIILPDGSTVWLNADSKLWYYKSFGNVQREVYLTGEAFFDVTKNPAKPFIIHTKLTDVRVLGTQFNVRSYPNDKTVETSLIRGLVQVTLHSRPDEKYFLKPNEKLVVLNVPDSVNTPKNIQPVIKNLDENIVAIKNLTPLQQDDSLKIETAWTKNRLCFTDESFDEVAHQLERWYDVQFVFKNDKYKNIRLNGSFVNETLTQALDALKFSTNFHYEIKDKMVTIY